MSLASIRRSIEVGISATSYPIGLGFMRLTRPNPWRKINDTTESLYIHIPRTAGGAISVALFDGVKSSHMPAETFLAHDPQRFESYFKFAFVRNPFDRFVSAYHRVLVNPSNPKTKRFGENHVQPYGDFQSFVHSLKSRHQRNTILAHPHFAPQFDQLATNGKIELDFLGRFENIAADFAELSGRFPNSRPLGVANRTPHKDFTEHYDKQTLEIIGEIYKTDLINFGYEAPLIS